ncbi:MAG: helix-turn-helix domain-containing protein [Beijerinckiaceae bacterium]
MRVGYARIGPLAPAARLQSQVDQLRQFGAHRIACEQEPLTRASLLAETIRGLSPGDELVIVHLGAIAADANGLFDVLAQLAEKGAKLHARAIGVTCDVLSPIVASLMRELARAGNEAKTETTATGAAPSTAAVKRGGKGTAQAHTDRVISLAGEGMTREAIASYLGIGVASVYRILKAARDR